MRAITACLACLAAVVTAVAVVRHQSAPTPLDRPGAAATSKKFEGPIETAPDIARPPPARSAIPVATAVSPESDEPLPSSRIVARFDTLTAQAERGDVGAARQLYDSLAHCLRASRSAAAGPAADATPGAGSRRWRAAWFETQCASYRPSHYARLLDITAAGAKAGDDYLRGEYYALDPLTNGAFEPQQFGQYRDNAREFLADMAARDNPDGYRLLSDAYAAGRIVGRDETAAYAYYLAWRDASPAQPQGSSAPPPFAARLSAEQLRQAEALSRDIRRKAPHS